MILFGIFIDIFRDSERFFIKFSLRDVVDVACNTEGSYYKFKWYFLEM